MLFLSLSPFRLEGRDDSFHQTPRVHHAGQRFGSSVAGRGTGAAADACGRVPQPRSIGVEREQCDRISKRSERDRVCRDQNVTIEYRWAEGRYEQLPQLAADLVNRKVAVIVAAYFPSAVAAKAATLMIPIVFISGVDPIAAGLVASLNRPGGNLTGLTNYNVSLTAKRLELLHQVAPRSGTVAVLVNSKSPATQTIEAEARAAAQALGLRVEVLGAGTEDEIDAAFVIAVQRGSGALLVSGDAFFNSRRSQFTALAAHHKFPAIYDRREIAMAGGLMSYGMNYFDIYRQAGIYTGQILKGAGSG